MRIVQIIINFALGGSNKAGCLLASTMADMGHDAWVLGGGGGPRFRPEGGTRLTHEILPDLTPETVHRALVKIQPDVVHIHAGEFVEPTLAFLAPHARDHKWLIVSTPVFGRPPLEKKSLALTRTCCVGAYTFYRMCRWLRLSAPHAIHNGIGYVPLTPFEPVPSPISALSDRATLETIREEFGLPAGHTIVGRIGRDDMSKWHPCNPHLVNSLLTLDPKVSWLSIGFPQALERESLEQRWGNRFRNLPETADYNRLTRALAAIDLQLFFSRHGECFASSISEAAGIGVPTVALATPLKDNGQAEQIIDGVTGMLVGHVPGAVEALRPLLAQPERITELKITTQRHALERWHARRAAADLLSLYEAWRLGQEDCPYQQLMIQEHDAFAKTYHARIVKLMGASPAKRLKWRLALNAVEFWPTFTMGRALKRLTERKV